MSPPNQLDYDYMQDDMQDDKWAEINLGLTPEQVLAKNFDYDTFAAIRAGIQLGLSPAQVLSAENFGYHTIAAIAAIMEEIPQTSWCDRLFQYCSTYLTTSLNAAFEKYRDLNSFQIEGMTEFGLTRLQVEAENFGVHTIQAIDKIQLSLPALSIDEVFNRVKGKTDQRTPDVLEKCRLEVKLQQKSITEMPSIRVIINKGGGFGHQRAPITLMQKLRELGFKGVFEILCDDKIGEHITDTKTNTVPAVSLKLKKMLPEIELSTLKKSGIIDVPGLGAITISSLPHDYLFRKNSGLQKADLAVCAGDDGDPYYAIVKRLNVTYYIGLQPTDWGEASCFVINQAGLQPLGKDLTGWTEGLTRSDQGIFLKYLPSALKMRLSSEAAHQLPDITAIHLSATEKRIIDITKKTGINTQLIYGFYPEKGRQRVDQQIQLIISANQAISQQNKMPTILLIPETCIQDYIKKHLNTIHASWFLWSNCWKKSHLSETDNSLDVRFVDLTQQDVDIAAYQPSDVIVAYTGHLQQSVFDHLLLKGTTLPPVIEGCNSREACESSGRSFLHAFGDPLRRYDSVLNKEKQELHANASLCIRRGDQVYLSDLVLYMTESLEGEPEPNNLMAYHKQRQAAFLERPDACEVALDSLGIAYKKGCQIEEVIEAAYATGNSYHV